MTSEPSISYVLHDDADVSGSTCNPPPAPIRPTNQPSGARDFSAPTKLEQRIYYEGVSPTPPKLVYRTDSLTRPWIEPTGLERLDAVFPLREARGVFGAPINAVWDQVRPQIQGLLNGQQISWTSIDLVHFFTFSYFKKFRKTAGPVVVWVGVSPDSLQAEDASRSAKSILQLLARFDIADVEVEYRE
ncbi:hypothetical protein AURDEDRAFT_66118, partial [Auricularia subglabra TFB-10046 SS5]